MRTFIAIELPETIRIRLSALQKKIQDSAAGLKWVNPQNIHLTLKFIGERDEKKVKEIREILKEVAGKNYSYAATISSLGIFPAKNSPRVIWAGIEEGDKETKEIAKELEEKISKIGIPKETRPFSSHITLARVKSALSRESLIQELDNLTADLTSQNLSFPVEKIFLFKSTLAPLGSIYEVLEEANLKTT